MVINNNATSFKPVSSNTASNKHFQGSLRTSTAATGVLGLVIRKSPFSRRHFSSGKEDLFMMRCERQSLRLNSTATDNLIQTGVMLTARLLDAPNASNTFSCLSNTSTVLVHSPCTHQTLSAPLAHPRDAPKTFELSPQRITFKE